VTIVDIEMKIIEIRAIVITMKDRDTMNDLKNSKDLMKECLMIDTLMTGIQTKETSMNDNMTEIAKDIPMIGHFMINPHMTDSQMKGPFKMNFLKTNLLLTGITKIILTKIRILIKVSNTIKMLKTILELSFLWK
jgi:hypothetical protein